jgi:hypothetical protein
MIFFTLSILSLSVNHDDFVSTASIHTLVPFNFLFPTPPSHTLLAYCTVTELYNKDGNLEKHLKVHIYIHHVFLDPL